MRRFSEFIFITLANKPSGQLALAGVSIAHLLNDTMQTVIPASFPLFQQTMQLSFTQMGWIAFTLNITASVLQPLVGYISDRKPMPILLPGGMLCSLIGMLGFAFSSVFWMLIASAAIVGIGARPSAVHLSGRGEYRRSDSSLNCSLSYSSARSAQLFMVIRISFVRYAHSKPCQSMVVHTCSEILHLKRC